jgi:hypothetical protein
MVEMSRARPIVPYMTPAMKTHRCPVSRNPISSSGRPNKKPFQTKPFVICDQAATSMSPIKRRAIVFADPFMLRSSSVVFQPVQC